MRLNVVYQLKMPRRICQRLACLALALFGLAVITCGYRSTAAAPAGSSIEGRYNLVTANGQNLPATVSQNPSTGYKQEVTGGYIDLRADQTCTVATEYRYANRGVTSASSSRDEGTYVISGETITLTIGSEKMEARLTGGVLTIRADVELVYRKK